MTRKEVLTSMFYRISNPIFKKDYLLILKILKDYSDKIAIVYYPSVENKNGINEFLSWNWLDEKMA